MSILGKISDNQYNEMPELRNTDLGKIKKSWAHYLGNPAESDEQTDAMRFGSAFHAFTLEEDVFWATHAVAPEGMDRRTKEGKKLWEDLQNSGKTIIKHDEYMTIQKMRDALRNHPMAKNILTRSENEGAYTAELEGVQCKCKVDLSNKGYVFDLKTTMDASPEEFRRSIGKYNYERQAAFYTDILKANKVEVKGFVFVAVEKSFPFNVGVYMLEEDSAQLGRNDYLKILSTYKAHKADPTLHSGYSDKIMSIASPNWRFMESAVGA
jgi:hypothetical protein